MVKNWYHSFLVTRSMFLFSFILLRRWKFLRFFFSIYRPWNKETVVRRHGSSIFRLFVDYFFDVARRLNITIYINYSSWKLKLKASRRSLNAYKVMIHDGFIIYTFNNCLLRPFSCDIIPHARAPWILPPRPYLPSRGSLWTNLCDIKSLDRWIRRSSSYLFSTLIFV